VCKKPIKNSQPFGNKFQKTVGEGFFLTHTICDVHTACCTVTNVNMRLICRSAGQVHWHLDKYSAG